MLREGPGRPSELGLAVKNPSAGVTQSWLKSWLPLFLLALGQLLPEAQCSAGSRTLAVPYLKSSPRPCGQGPTIIPSRQMMKLRSCSWEESKPRFPASLCLTLQSLGS